MPKLTPAARAAPHTYASPSPAFAALHRERVALRRTAEEADAAIIADAGDDDPREQAAQAARAALWAADDHLMATPAEQTADIGMKAAFLAEQIEEFGHLERRYAEAIVADLCRLFPQPDPRNPASKPANATKGA